MSLWKISRISEEKVPVVCSVSEVGERTGERVLLSPAPTAVVGGLVASSPSNVELGPPAMDESVTEIEMDQYRLNATLLRLF